jgi:hypothetical protein
LGRRHSTAGVNPPRERRERRGDDPLQITWEAAQGEVSRGASGPLAQRENARTGPISPHPQEVLVGRPDFERLAVRSNGIHARRDCRKLSEKAHPHRARSQAMSFAEPPKNSQPMPGAEERKMVGHGFKPDPLMRTICSCGEKLRTSVFATAQQQHAAHVAALASQVPAQPTAQPVGNGVLNKVFNPVPSPPEPTQVGHVWNKERGICSCGEWCRDQAERNYHLVQVYPASELVTYEQRKAPAPVPAQGTPPAQPELGLCERSAAPHPHSQTRCKGWVPLPAPASPQNADTLEQDDEIWEFANEIARGVHAAWDERHTNMEGRGRDKVVNLIRTKLRAALAESEAARGVLEALANEWLRIANLKLEPLKLKTRDETMALSGIETGAQATRKVCAEELLRALAAQAPKEKRNEHRNECGPQRINRQLGKNSAES